MSDIRFNNWKHQSGTGGVVQDAAGKVGIGSTQPTSMLDVGGDGKFTGVVTATSFSGSGANLTSLPAANITGTLPAIDGSNLTGIDASSIKNGSDVKVQANASGAVVTGILTANSLSITDGTTSVNKHSVGIGTTTTAGRNAGVSTATGTIIFNASDTKVQIYTGNTWKSLQLVGELGADQNNPATSAAALIADGQSTDGYYWIRFPNESSATQRWCDLTNGYMLIAHWSPNSTSGSGDATATPGSTSYATGTGGYSGVNANAVAAPNGSGDEATTYTWVWDADTRGTQTGGSFFRNNTTSNSGTSAATVHTKGYIPKHYGFNWQYMKWGVRVSAPGGTSANTSGGDNYNSMDNFSPGTNDINRVYVDGLSITHGANATDGSGSGRNHIFTVNVNGSNTQGNNGGSTPSFVSDGNGNNNMASHSGTSTSSYNDFSNTYDKGSASDTRIEMRIQSDQQSANEDLYVRAWYILIK